MSADFTPLITLVDNLRAVAEVSILSHFQENALFGQRRLGCQGSCIMDDGTMGPSDRGIIAAALH